MNAFRLLFLVVVLAGSLALGMARLAPAVVTKFNEDALTDRARVESLLIAEMEKSADAERHGLTLRISADASLRTALGPGATTNPAAMFRQASHGLWNSAGAQVDTLVLLDITGAIVDSRTRIATIEPSVFVDRSAAGATLSAGEPGSTMFAVMGRMFATASEPITSATGRTLGAVVLVQEYDAARVAQRRSGTGSSTAYFVGFDVFASNVADERVIEEVEAVVRRTTSSTIGLPGRLLLSERRDFDDHVVVLAPFRIAEPAETAAGSGPEVGVVTIVEGIRVADNLFAVLAQGRAFDENASDLWLMLALGLILFFGGLVFLDTGLERSTRDLARRIREDATANDPAPLSGKDYRPWLRPVAEAFNGFLEAYRAQTPLARRARTAEGSGAARIFHVDTSSGVRPMPAPIERAPLDFEIHPPATSFSGTSSAPSEAVFDKLEPATEPAPADPGVHQLTPDDSFDEAVASDLNAFFDEAAAAVDERDQDTTPEAGEAPPPPAETRPERALKPPRPETPFGTDAFHTLGPDEADEDEVVVPEPTADAVASEAETASPDPPKEPEPQPPEDEPPSEKKTLIGLVLDVPVGYTRVDTGNEAAVDTDPPGALEALDDDGIDDILDAIEGKPRGATPMFQFVATAEEHAFRRAEMSANYATVPTETGSPHAIVDELPNVAANEAAPVETAKQPELAPTAEADESKPKLPADGWDSGAETASAEADEAPETRAPTSAPRTEPEITPPPLPAAAARPTSSGAHRAVESTPTTRDAQPTLREALAALDQADPDAAALHEEGDATEETPEESPSERATVPRVSIEDLASQAAAERKERDHDAVLAAAEARLRELRPKREQSSRPPDDVEQALFDEFVAAKDEAGEDTARLTVNRFVAKLDRNRSALIDRYGCRDVRFEVAVRAGKVTLKATPVR